jgi:hypothetical protein
MSSLVRSRHRLLRRLLDRPDLPQRVRALPTPRLAALVEELGLEDSAPVLACASADQLGELLDQDLFDGQDAIDAGRFLVWLEVLLEVGERFAAERVAALPADLLRGVLAQVVLVFDVDALALAIADDGSLSDANDRLEAGLTEELLGYLLVIRRPEGWDTLWRVLLELSERHAELVRRLLEPLADRSMARARREGLDSVLDAAEEAAEDAAAEREERITGLGYVSASDARAFLALAESGEGDPDRRDAVTAAWFRRLAPLPPAGEPVPTADVAWLDASAPALTAGKESGPSARLRAALTALAASDPATHDQRVEELAYLANVCASVAEAETRQERYVAGLERAVERCGAGLELGSRSAASDMALLRERSLDLLFRDGSRG